MKRVNFFIETQCVIYNYGRLCVCMERYYTVCPEKKFLMFFIMSAIKRGRLWWNLLH